MEQLTHPFFRPVWSLLLAAACLTVTPAAAGPINRHSCTHSLAAGDFDGDGAADAAWILPNGDIRLLSPSTGLAGVVPGTAALAIVGADLDGNGVHELVYVNASTQIRAISVPAGSDTQLPEAARNDSKLTAGDWDDDGDDGYIVTGMDGNVYGAEPTPGGIVYNSPGGVGQLFSYVAADVNPWRPGTEFTGFNVGTIHYNYNGGTSGSYTATGGSGLNAIAAGNVNDAAPGDEVLVAVRGNELWRWNSAAGWARLPGAGAVVGAGSVDPALGGRDEWFVIGDPPGYNLWRYVNNDHWELAATNNNDSWEDFVLSDFDGDGVDEILALRANSIAPLISDPARSSTFQVASAPAGMADGLRLWLDASDSATIVTDGTGAIQEWMDKSGNGHNATQPDDFERPVVNATAVNGQPAVRFDGTDDGILIDDGLSLGRPYTAFIVDQYYGSPQGRTLQGRDANWLMGKWAGQNAHYANGFVYNPGAGAGIGNAVIGEAVGYPTSSEYLLNGRNVTQSTAPTGSPGRLGLVGEGLYPAEQSQADVAEVIVYDRTLTYYERALVGQYLGGKYGIPTTYSTHLATRARLFTGADPSEGLDMQGDFVHAVNVRGPGGMTVGDATFTDDAGVVTAENEILNWISPAYGPGADDTALATVMQSLRWTATGDGGIETLDAALPNLVPGRSYKLQMLFAEGCCNRGFDVFVEGSQLYDDFSPYAISGGADHHVGVVLAHQFQATDSVLNVVLSGAASTYPDRNPILQAITIEDLGVTGRTTINSFSGGDVGEGLDFEGNFVYALNIGGQEGGFRIGDALFTVDTATPGVHVNAENVITGGWAGPNFGSSPNDDGLELLTQSIRWTDTNARGEILGVDLEGLIPGEVYKLQLLFDEGCCNRGFDVVIDDILVADELSPWAIEGGVNGALGSVLSYTFTAQDDTLNIVLDGYSAAFPDGNPILNGLTLEFIPEPSTALLLGLGALGLARRLRRRRHA